MPRGRAHAGSSHAPVGRPGRASRKPSLPRLSRLGHVLVHGPSCVKGNRVLSKGRITVVSADPVFLAREMNSALDDADRLERAETGCTIAG